MTMQPAHAAPQAYLDLLPFHRLWAYNLMQAAQRLAMDPPYRGHNPRGMGQRVMARSMGFQSFKHMVADAAARQKAAQAAGEATV